MKLRLDTYPEDQIAAQMLHPPQTPSSIPTLCCLLHTGTLPSSHQLQVWVGGVQQRAEPEGTHLVFSWHCLQEVEMRIEMRRQGRPTKSWRGWWRGGTTIAHTGTLAVQVFCAGIPQPAGSALPIPSSPPAPSTAIPVSLDQSNGRHSQDTSTVLTWPAVLDPPTPSPSTPDAAPEDDLWSALPSHGQMATTPAEEQARDDFAHESREEVEDGEEVELAEDGEDEWAETATRETRAAEETERAEERDAPQAQKRAEAPGESLAVPFRVAPAGTTIATFPAQPVWSETAHQEELARLTALLATMPPTTILVDLRQHRPTRRAHRAASRSQALGLSKDRLRSLYGGRYWERGSQIQTARHVETTHPLRFRRVVVHPEDPDGLGALVTALARGFSLVLLDGETSYAESARAAVLSELRQRVANVHEGPCS